MVGEHLGAPPHSLSCPRTGIAARGSDEEGWEAFPGESLVNILE